MNKNNLKVVFFFAICMLISSYNGSDAIANSSDTLSGEFVVSDPLVEGEDANNDEDIYIMWGGGLMVKKNGELVPYESTMSKDELFRLTNKNGSDAIANSSDTLSGEFVVSDPLVEGEDANNDEDIYIK